MRTVTKDTTLCVSLAARPSNIGTRFHNFLYEALDLDYVYKAFAPADLAGAVAGVRGLPIRGAAVSMPYKEAVIPMLDELDPSAAVLQSVNTIVNTDGHLVGHNTDYTAVASLLRSHAVPVTPVLLRGSGGMAKAVGAALRDAGFTDGTLVARNEATGRALADELGWSWAPDVDGRTAPLVVNVTPLGMTGADADVQAFDDATVAAASVVFDVVALPAETPLIRAARASGTPVLTGAEVIALQAEEQFVLYTGVRPDPALVREASEWSRRA